jgi:hypothetical protein
LKSTRSRLSYANVTSTIALFLVLGGATAFAAAQLGPESVGSRELKREAVTTQKISGQAVAIGKVRDEAISTRKLAGGAVDTAKLANAGVTSDKLADGAVLASKLANGSVITDGIADGAVTSGKLANRSVTADKLAVALPATTLERLRGTAVAEFPKAERTPLPPVTYPFHPTYTQPAGRLDQYLAGFQVTFPATCTGRRSAQAALFIDTAPGAPEALEQIGEGFVEDASGGEVTRTGEFFAGAAAQFSLPPDAATQHTFSISLLRASCGNFVAGVKMTGAEVDVVGLK